MSVGSCSWSTCNTSPIHPAPWELGSFTECDADGRVDCAMRYSCTRRTISLIISNLLIVKRL
eukprot:2581334-Prymnesium_polylepis.1